MAKTQDEIKELLSTNLFKRELRIIILLSTTIIVI